jgi:hypothetical protein
MGVSFLLNLDLLNVELGARRVAAAPGSIALRATEPAERFPPIRVTIRWRKMCYHFG